MRPQVVVEWIYCSWLAAERAHTWLCLFCSFLEQVSPVNCFTYILYVFCMNAQIALQRDICWAMCWVYKQEVMAAYKIPCALFSPPLVGSIQAKLQLADARQWPVGCRQGSSAKPRWAQSECACGCMSESAGWVCLCPCAFVSWRCSCPAFWVLLFDFSIFFFFCTFACNVIKNRNVFTSPGNGRMWSGKR